MRLSQWMSAFTLLLTLPCYAEQALGTETKSQLEIVSWLMSLGLVLVTIFVCAWVLKKMRFSQFGGAKAKVVTTLALGARERVMVVEIGQQQYLLGVTAQSIQLLDKLDTPLEVETGAAAERFSRQLQGIWKKHEK